MHKDIDAILEDLSSSNCWQYGLDRIEQAFADLKINKKLAPIVITIAGTNGKGSTAYAISLLYKLQGFSVGTYLSPHLINFNERILINCNPINKHNIQQEIIELMPYFKQQTLSYYEMVTLVAAKIFVANKVQVLIVEIGVGGRLDAANVINNDVAVITNVDLDHKEFLGCKNIDEIGAEKAGIIQNNSLVILGCHNMTVSVKKRIADLNVDHIQANKDFSYEINNDYSWNYISKINKFINLPAANIPLQSISTAIAVYENYMQNGLPLSQQKLISLCKYQGLPGRLVKITTPYKIYLDVAHNRHSIANLFDFLQQKENLKNKKVIAICGFLRDKINANLVTKAKPFVKHWSFVSTHGERGITSNTTQKKLNLHNSSIHINLEEAINFSYAEIRDKKEDLIIIFGSFQLIKEAYRLFKIKSKFFIK